MTDARYTGAAVPQGAFSATARAFGNLVGTANQITDSLVQKGFEAQDIRNKEEIRSKTNDMRNLQKEFMSQLEADNVDPSEWVPRWENRLNEFKTQLYKKGDPTDVITALDRNFEEFMQDSTVHLTGAMLKENRRRAVAGYELDYGEALKDGRFDDARRITEEYAGILDPVQHKGAMLAIAREEKKAKLELDLDSDPLAFMERLQNNEYDLSPIQRKDWSDIAQRELATRERQGLQAVDTMLELNGFENEEQLNKFLDTFPEISEPKRALVRKSFYETQPIPDSELYPMADKIRADYMAYHAGKLSYDEYQTRWNNNQSEVLAYGSKRPNSGGLRHLLSRLDPLTIDPNAPRKGAVDLGETEDVIEHTVSERVQGQIRTEVATFGSGQDVMFAPDKDVKIAKFRGEREEFAVGLRSELTKGVKQFAADTMLEKKRPPTSAEIRAELDRLQPIVVERMIKEQQALKGKRTVHDFMGAKLPRPDAPERTDGVGAMEMTEEALRYLNPKPLE